MNNRQKARAAVNGSASFAEDLMRHAEAQISQVYAQREEIMRAFIAKHGYQPDECIQIKQGDKWMVVRMDPDEQEKLRQTVFRFRIGSEPLTRWQRFCIWLSRV